MNMENLTNIGIAVGLAMDAFAVSVSCGLSIKKRHVLRNAAYAGITFGTFQAGMAYIGYAAGLLFRDYIQAYNHWVAFALLVFIGGKMLKEAFSGDSEPIVLTGMITLITLAVATSIDALAAGLSYATLNKNMITPTIIIGITALMFSFGGVFLGSAVRNTTKLGKRVDILGGVILIGIGTKILLEQLL